MKEPRRSASPMEPTAHMEAEIQESRGTNSREEEPSEEEKQFLKELYTFMRRRDTPIERIPNLGFKQIDLYLMYMSVAELGGYQLVTAQQLWKQVYNSLGGNPRSTSAATCTRRHYEKLLLPYECHVKGVLMSFPPQLQPRHFQPAKFGKDEGSGPLAASRRLIPVGHLHQQNVHPLQPNQYRSAFHQPFHLPHFYHRTPAAPPRLFPMPPPSVLPPLTPAALQPKFPFEPHTRGPVEVAKEPLEHLRYLAERYKSSSGLSEPLNLSVRAPKREAPSAPASSFTQPPSVKNPKFLNKPSSLYSPPGPKVARSEQSETLIEVDCEAASSPTHQSTFGPQPGRRPSSPKPSDSPPQSSERRADGPESRELGFSQLLSAGVPRQNQKGEMEIEIPLSLFQKWLQLCKFPEQRRPPDRQRKQHSPPGNRSDSGAPPQNLTFRTNPPTAEDLSMRRVNSGPPHRHQLPAHNPLGGRNPPAPLGIPHGSPGWDGKYQTDQHRDIPRPYTTGRFPDIWAGREQRTSSSEPLKVQVQQSREVLRSYSSEDAFQRRSSSDPPKVQVQHSREVLRSYSEDVSQRTSSSDPLKVQVQQSREALRSYSEDSSQRTESAETSPPAVLFLNSTGSSPLLQLTSDEVIKLKRIISGSS